MDAVVKHVHVFVPVIGLTLRRPCSRIVLPDEFRLFKFKFLESLVSWILQNI